MNRIRLLVWIPALFLFTEALAQNSRPDASIREMHQADSLYKAGLLCVKSKPESGIASLKEAQFLFRNHDRIKEEIDCILALAEIHLRLSDYDIAHSLLTNASSLALENNLPDPHLMALMSLGRLSGFLGETQRARSFFQDAEGLAQSLNRTNLVLLSRAYIAYHNLYYLQDNADSNFTAIQNLYFRVSGPPVDTLILMTAANLLGGAQNRVKANPQKAAYFYQQSIDLARGSGDLYRTALVYNNLAEMWLQYGQVAKAREILSRSLEIGREIQAKLIIYNAYRMLSRCAEAEGNPAAALEYFRSYQEIKEEVLNETMIRKTEANYSLYQVEKQARMAENVRNEKRVSELRSEAQVMKYQVFSAAIAMMTLVLGYFLFENRRKLSEIRKQNKTIENQNIELQRLNQDLTEQRLKVESSSRQAQEAIQSKIDFLSVMTHEIRTPINAVIGTVQLLKEENPLPYQNKSLEILTFSAENLLNLVNDILDFNKIEAGKVELDPKPFSLRNLITNIRNSLRQKADEKGIDLILRMDRNLPEAFIGDALRIGQIFYNLVSNAVKFTSRGHVEIELRYYPDRELNNILAQIRDTGIGIDPANQERIFDFFSQAGPGIFRHFGGSGLGLTITRRLLELLGSSIQLESTPGLGSTFSFYLSLPETKASFIESTYELLTPDSEPQPRGRILFVEDVDFNRVVAERFFKKWGIDFDTATDSASAIQLASKSSYDLILMDLQLPDRDGFETVREIRKFPLNASVPVLAMTASGYYEVKEKMEAYKIEGYLSKPFVAQELRKTLLDWLNRRVAS